MDVVVDIRGSVLQMQIPILYPHRALCICMLKLTESQNMMHSEISSQSRPCFIDDQYVPAVSRIISIYLSAVVS